MDSARLDADASLDYSSAFWRRREHDGGVTTADAPRPHAQGTVTLGRTLGLDERMAHSFTRSASTGVVGLPYPEVLPLPTVRETYGRAHGAAARAAKRAFDLIFAILLLIALAPVWIAIAIAIKLDTPGPVLFRQRRIGQNGEAFSMFKFRTMVDGADEQKQALLHLNQAAEGLFKISQDPRITNVGGWLRATCLDEMPQLLNVITGRMSLVGPRPLVPEEDERITGGDRRRLAMRPGMTGVWQVCGASAIPIREMVVLDRDYLDGWSLWLDLKLLFLTARYVALRKGI
jgi:lipopolysaccharide/colanic/teichoic acid biosynthesis glycosyltransferase